LSAAITTVLLVAITAAALLIASGGDPGGPVGKVCSRAPGLDRDISDPFTSSNLATTPTSLM